MTMFRTVTVQILLRLLGQLIDVCVFVFGGHFSFPLVYSVWVTDMLLSARRCCDKRSL